MEKGMLYASVSGSSRIDGAEVDLDFRVEQDDRGLWHAGRMEHSVDWTCVCMTYANALVAVINECDRLGVDVYKLSVEH